MNISLNSFLIVLSLCFMDRLLAAQCLPDRKENNAYLAGIAEGATFEEAKAKAIADALSVLGSHVVSSTETTLTNSGTSIEQSIANDIDTTAKGFEVLSRCNVQDRHEVRVGVKKSLIAKLLNQRAVQRLDWLKDATNTIEENPHSRNQKFRKELSERVEQETSDLEQWLILGLSEVSFKKMPADELRSLKATPRVKSKNFIIHAGANHLSEKTLPFLIKRLQEQGMPVSAVKKSERGSREWDCAINRGMAIGNSIRFQARCLLDSDDNILEPIQVDGIAIEEDVENQATRLLLKRLSE